MDVHSLSRIGWIQRTVEIEQTFRVGPSLTSLLVATDIVQ